MLRTDDTMQIRKSTGGGAPVDVSLSELTTFVNTGVTARLDAIDATYDITEIDLDDEEGADYQITAASQTIVLTANYSTAWDILLPVGVAGLKIVVSNQHTAAVDVVPAGTEVINLVNSAITIATKESATFLCFATGKWAVI